MNKSFYPCDRDSFIRSLFVGQSPHAAGDRYSPYIWLRRIKCTADALNVAITSEPGINARSSSDCFVISATSAKPASTSTRMYGPAGVTRTTRPRRRLRALVALITKQSLEDLA